MVTTPECIRWKMAHLSESRISSVAEPGPNMLVHDLGFSHRACDRCHGQKLRCRRESNSNTCVRCAKAGVRCNPRPMRLRSRAQSIRNTQQQSQRHANSNSTTQHHVDQEELTNDAADEHPDHFNYLTTSLLEMPTDLNMGLDPSSLQADLHPALTAAYDPAGTESRAHELHDNQPPSSQALSHSRTAEQGVQTRWRDAPNHDNSDDLCDFSLPTSMHSSFPSVYHRHRSSLARAMSPQYAQQQEQDDMMADFDREGNSKSPDRRTSRTDSGYGNEFIPSDLLRSPSGDAPDSEPELRENQQDQNELLSAMSSWIRRLSDTNFQLHQHMHSIPVVGTGQRVQGSDPAHPQGSIDLPVDFTFNLSSQYTGLLTTICAQLESRRSSNDTQTLAPLALDQPSQLLVLSSYMCLLASYDKILQHIKAWLEVRLKMGVRGSAAVLAADEGSACFPIQLPNVAVGSFELSRTSSTPSLVLTCMMETNVMQMHSLISEIMRPGSTDAIGSASRADSGPSAADKRPNGVANAGEGLSTVATVTLQAIKANEDSTLQLVHTVSRLALQRVML